MTPKQIKFINARCEEMNWLTEKIEAINKLALIAAEGGKTITISISVTGDQPREWYSFEAYKERLENAYKNMYNLKTNATTDYYAAEISDEETLAILGILMGELADQQQRVKNYLTKNGVTI